MRPHAVALAETLSGDDDRSGIVGKCPFGLRETHDPEDEDGRVMTSDATRRPCGAGVPRSAHRNASISPTSGFAAWTIVSHDMARRLQLVGDRTEEEPELDQERQRLADVAVADVRRRKEERRPDREREGDDEKRHGEDDPPGGIDAVERRDDEEQARARRGSRASTETIAASGIRIRGLAVFVTMWMFITRLSEPVSTARDTKIHSVRPASANTAYGTPGSSTLRQVRERERVDEQQRERLEDHPRRPELRLRVPDLDVTPDEE